LWVLVRTVGLPYFGVAATAPLLQGWYAQEAGAPEHPAHLPSPYVLYAVSNVGSLLALVSYPFVIEPGFGLRMQFAAWSIGYAVFAVAVAILAWPRTPRALPTNSESTRRSEARAGNTDEGPRGREMRGEDRRGGDASGERGGARDASGERPGARDASG